MTNNTTNGNNNHRHDDLPMEQQLLQQQQQQQQQDRIQDILQLASWQHERDFETSLSQSGIQPEKVTTSTNTSTTTSTSGPNFEWVCPSVNSTTTTATAILKTTVPILNPEQCQQMILAARGYWNNDDIRDDDDDDDNDDNQKSRFTFQSNNKREVHLSDVVKQKKNSNHGLLSQMINEEILPCQLYPLIRRAFFGNNNNDDDNDLQQQQQQKVQQFFLYDSLIIEYDATTTIESDSYHPAQPLHRDLGLISVNIALNDPVEFQGGGTVFENYLLQQQEDTKTATTTTTGILPPRAGCAVAHPCRERHAGGALYGGKRIIWVLFFSGICHENNNNRCHSWELAARCKAIGMTLSSSSSNTTLPIPSLNNSRRPPLSSSSVEDRLHCYRAAMQADPSDGEAYLLLAMTLLSSVASSSPTSLSSLTESITLLQTAKELIPNDGRVHNTLGIAMKRLKEQQEQLVVTTNNNDENQTTQGHDTTGDNDVIMDVDDTTILKSFEKACQLHILAAQAGCQGAAQEARSSLFNAALWYANRDDFLPAIDLLEQICESGPVAHHSAGEEEMMIPPPTNIKNPKEWQALRVVQDAQSLLRFCRRQM